MHTGGLEEKVEEEVKKSFTEKLKDFLAEHDKLASVLFGAGFFTITAGPMFVLNTLAWNTQLLISNGYLNTLREYIASANFLNDSISDPNIVTPLILSAGISYLLKHNLDVRKACNNLGISDEKGTILDEKIDKEISGRSFLESVSAKGKYYLHRPLNFLTDHPLPIIALGLANGLRYSFYAMQEVLSELNSLPPAQQDAARFPLLQAALSPAFVTLCGAVTLYTFLKTRSVKRGLYSASQLTTRTFYAILNDLFGFTEKATDEYRKAFKETNKPDLLSAAGSILIKRGRVEEGLEIYLQTIRDADIPFFDLPKELYRGLFAEELTGAYARFVKDPGNIPAAVALATNLHRLNHPEKAVEILRRMVEKNPQLLQLPCFASYFCSAIGQDEGARRFLEEVAPRIVREKSLRREQIGESKYATFVIGPSNLIRRTFVFKEGSDMADFKAERELTLIAGRLLQEHPGFTVPLPLGIVGYDHSFAYVMRRESGEELSRLKSSQHFREYLEDILDYMALLYGTLPIESTAKRRVNVQENMEQRFKGSVVPQNILGKLRQNLGPVYPALLLVYVFDKDPHEDNWLVAPDNVSYKVVGLDWEDKGFKPFSLQSAKLFGNLNMPFEEERKLVLQLGNSYTQHASGFNAERGELSSKEGVKDADALLLGHLNALIYTAANLLVVLEDKKTKQDTRLGWQRTGRKAVEQLRQQFPGYYNTHETNYQELSLALEQAEQLIMRTQAVIPLN